MLDTDYVIILTALFCAHQECNRSWFRSPVKTNNSL